jgi:hypothetical protein
MLMGNYNHKKILFLDCDGVLNSKNWVTRERKRRLELTGVRDFVVDEVDPVAISLLNGIIEETNCCVVISSSWRSTHTMPEILAKFEAAGFVHHAAVIGKTGLLGSLPKRGHKIQHWLDQHPETERYCILDDIPDMLPIQRDSFVRTFDDVGLTARDQFRCIKILNKKAET